MEQHAFKQLLQNLKTVQDNQLKEEYQSIYFNFRSQNPSDNFVQVLVTEVLDAETPEIQGYAQVLMRQDIEKLEQQCCLNRLTNPDDGKAIVLQIMHYAAQNPSIFLSKIISSYAVLRVTMQKEFDEIYDYIFQASASENASVRQMVVQIAAELCMVDPKHFKFDIMDFVQKMLEDTDAKVATFAVDALFRLIEFDEAAQNIPDEVKCQIVLAVLNRIAQTLAAGLYEDAKKQLDGLCDIVELCGDVVIQQLPAVIQLLDQILSNDEVTEPVKYKSVFIFKTICDFCDNLRKTVAQQLAQFTQQQLIPNLCMSDEDLEEWLQTEKDYEYDDVSLRAGCEDAILSVTQVLGREVMMQILKQLFDQAIESGHWKQCQAALVCLHCASEGLSELVKQSDVDLIAERVLQLINHNNPRVRYECLNCMSIISDDFKPRLQKHHKTILPLLLQQVNDENTKVKEMSAISILNYSQFMNFEQTFPHINGIIATLAQYFAGTMKMQQGGMLLIASMCETIDQEDIVPMLNQFMPQVFTLFQQVMESVQTQAEFTYQQVEFICAILDCVQSAAKALPSLFNDVIDQVLQSFVTVSTRALRQQEFDLIEQALKSLSALHDEFKDKSAQYIDQLYPILLEVLTTDAVKYSSDPTEEAEPIYDANQNHLLTQVMIHMTEYLQFYPQLYVQHFDELFTEFKDMKPQNVDQKILRHEALAALLCVASKGDLQFQEIHAKIADILYNEIMPGGDEKLVVYSLQQVGNYAEAMEIYLEAYITHAMEKNDFQSFAETMQNVFKIMEYIYKCGNASLKNAVEEAQLDMDDLEADEKTAVAVQIIDDYDATVDAIAAAYSVIIQTFKEQIPPEITLQVLEAAKMMMHEGVQSDYGVLSTMQGAAICADFAQFCSAEVCMQIFPPLIGQFIGYLEEKPDEWQLIQVIFYALASFVQVAQCEEVASNPDLAVFAVKTLESAREDGSEDAMCCYDNVCGFLLKAGHCANQGADFWTSLLEACLEMNKDGEEVAFCIRYLVNHFQSNKGLQANAQLVVKVLVQLAFGQFYSVIKNTESNADEMKKVKAMLQQPQHRELVQQLVEENNEFVKKNFQQFFAE